MHGWKNLSALPRNFILVSVHSIKHGAGDIFSITNRSALVSAMRACTWVGLLVFGGPVLYGDWGVNAIQRFRVRVPFPSSTSSVLRPLSLAGFLSFSPSPLQDLIRSRENRMQQRLGKFPAKPDRIGPRICIPFRLMSLQLTLLILILQKEKRKIHTYHW
jgi:hypothetical protein